MSIRGLSGMLKSPHENDGGKRQPFITYKTEKSDFFKYYKCLPVLQVCHGFSLWGIDCILLFPLSASVCCSNYQLNTGINTKEIPKIFQNNHFIVVNILGSGRTHSSVICHVVAAKCSTVTFKIPFTKQRTTRGGLWIQSVKNLDQMPKLSF